MTPRAKLIWLCAMLAGSTCFCLLPKPPRNLPPAPPDMPKASNIKAPPRPRWHTNYLYLGSAKSPCDLMASTNLKAWTCIATNIGATVVLTNTGGRRFFKLRT